MEAQGARGGLNSQFRDALVFRLLPAEELGFWFSDDSPRLESV